MGVKVVPGELSAGAKAQVQVDEPSQAQPRELLPQPVETPTARPFTDESVPELLSPYPASSPVRRLLKFALVLALILLGLYLMSQRYRDRSSTGLSQTGSPPQGQSSLRRKNCSVAASDQRKGKKKNH